MKEIMKQIQMHAKENHIRGIRLENGITNEEIATIEKRYNIVFPKSLIIFYRECLPVQEDYFEFVDWRNTSEDNVESIKERLRRPYEEMCWEMEHGFWVYGWDRPDTLEDRKKTFMEKMRNEPRPIPVYSHRYILYKEGIDDPAVLSMAGSDIIVYGNNLKECLENDFCRNETGRIHDCCYLKHMGKWIDVMESYGDHVSWLERRKMIGFQNE